jgi:osmotically-inducible protein OsmY
MRDPVRPPLQPSRPLRHAACAALLGLLATGCPQMLIAQGAKMAAGIVADDRSIAQQTADVGLKGQIEQALLSASTSLAASVNVDVFIGRVMLTGVVPDSDARWTAVRTARSLAGEHEVYDDIEIGTPGGLSSAAGDAVTNKTLGVNLLAGEGLASQSLLHRVVNGTAFVMGEVHSVGQIESVRSIALQTPGVHQVVTHIRLEAAN